MKKFTFFILAMLLASVLLVSCGPDKTSGDTSSPDVSGSVDNGLFEDLRSWDGGGRDFVILVPGNEYPDRYKSIEVGAEELNNEIINDAVYERNLLVETKYNIDIKAYATEQGEYLTEMVRNNNNNGLHLYDIVTPMMNEAVALAAEDALYDLYSSEISADLDLTKPWWDQNANKDLAIGGKLFFSTGHIAILDNYCTQCIIFNKTVVADHDLESPYALVTSGRWTYDEMNRQASAVTSDTDGVNGMTAADTYGLWLNVFSGQSLFVGSGQRFADLDENGTPRIAINDSGAAAVVEQLAALIGGNKDVNLIERIPTSMFTGTQDCYSYTTEAFANGRALFRHMCLADLNELADYQCSYGILPMPKASEEQDSYYCLVSTPYVTAFSIPTIHPAPEEAALVMSAMAEASTDTLDYAYYEQVLKNRRVVDDESKEMLDIIFNNRVYDLGVVFNWGGIKDVMTLGNAISETGTSQFASYWDSIESSVTAAMNQTIDAFS